MNQNLRLGLMDLEGPCSPPNDAAALKPQSRFRWKHLRLNVSLSGQGCLCLEFIHI